MKKLAIFLLFCFFYSNHAEAVGDHFFLGEAIENTDLPDKANFFEWVKSIRSTPVYYWTSRVLTTTLLVFLLKEVWILAATSCTDTSGVLLENGVCQAYGLVDYYFIGTITVALKWLVASAEKFMEEHHDTQWSQLHDEL